MNYEQTICELLRSTNRKGIEQTIDWLCSEPSFFDAAASNHSHDNWRGGLASHSWEVYQEGITDWESRDETFKQQYPRESVILATLLHDVFKKDVYVIAEDGFPGKNKGVRALGHGHRSAKLLEKIGLELNREEYLAIWWHMGQHELKEKEYKPKNPYQQEYEEALSNPFCQLVEQADRRAEKASKRKTENEKKNLTVWDPMQISFELRNKSPRVQTAIRQRVYKHNLLTFNSWNYQTATGKTISLGDRQALLDATRVYTESVSADAVPARTETTRTGCANEDCLVIAKQLIDRGLNPAVLNLADAYHACGLYNSGSGAQEESLCRASTLSLTLYQYYNKMWAQKAGVPLRPVSAYPMDPRHGGIYSPQVTVFRDNASTGYALREEPFQTAIISVAALNFRDPEKNKTQDLQYMSEDGGFTPEGRQIMLDKIRTIYRIALQNGHDSVVMGAFGCGVFKLKPELVSAYFKEVLEESEFRNKFKAVVFAMLEGKGGIRKKVEYVGAFAPFYHDFGRWK